jgi:hypothetical protein
MPIVTTPPSNKADPPSDAPHPAVGARPEFASRVGKKQSEPQPADAADDRYDNVACTD